MTRALSSLILLLCLACAGTFNPDLGNEDDSADTDDPSASASVSSTSVGMTFGSDSSSAEEDSSGSSGDDGEASSESGGTTPACGDGILNLDEQCDGEDLGEQTCESFLGGPPASGVLGCFNNCTFDVHACSLGGPQPEDGLFSSCANYMDCIPEGKIDDGTWDCYATNPPNLSSCTKHCEFVGDCGPSPGGTAVTKCYIGADKDCGAQPNSCVPEQVTGICVLDCEHDPEGCPVGMFCAGLHCETMNF